MKRIAHENTPVETNHHRPRLDKEYEILLDALGFEPAGLDLLVVRTGLKAGAVASMLLILELEGRVQQQPGGRFSRRLPGKV
jgi:DNA processing protein